MNFVLYKTYVLKYYGKSLGLFYFYEWVLFQPLAVTTKGASLFHKRVSDNQVVTCIESLSQEHVYVDDASLSGENLFTYLLTHSLTLCCRR